MWDEVKRQCQTVLKTLREGDLGQHLVAVEFPLARESWNTFIRRVFWGYAREYFGERRFQDYLQGVPGEISVKGKGRSWEVEDAGVWECRDEQVRGVRIGDAEGMSQVLEMKRLAMEFAEAERECCRCEIEVREWKLEMKKKESQRREAELGFLEAKLCFNSMKANRSSTLEGQAEQVDGMVDGDLRGLSLDCEGIKDGENAFDWGAPQVDRMLDMYTNVGDIYME